MFAKSIKTGKSEKEQHCKRHSSKSRKDAEGQACGSNQHGIAGAASPESRGKEKGHSENEPKKIGGAE